MNYFTLEVPQGSRKQAVERIAEEFGLTGSNAAGRGGEKD